MNKNNAKNKKIGIIDSGINPKFIRETQLQLIQAAYFEVDWQAKQLNKYVYGRQEIADWLLTNSHLSIVDTVGHGTAVTSILYHNIDTDVEYYIAKILGDNNSASGISLLKAMQWMIEDIQADYINISLGTVKNDFVAQMNKLCQQAHQQGSKLFAAVGGYPSLPAELAGVHSVATQPLAKFNQRNLKIDLVALDDNILLYNNGWEQVNSSSSFACPLMLAQVLNQETGKGEVN